MLFPFSGPVRTNADAGQTREVEVLTISIGAEVQVDRCRYEVVQVRFVPDQERVELTLARGEDTLRTVTFDADAKVPRYI